MTFAWNKHLDLRARLVFDRLIRFYNHFNIITALIAGLSLAVLSFTEFHPTTNATARAAEGFLCSSTLTSTVAMVVAIMLLFRFEGVDRPTRRDLGIAWIPLVLLDWAVVEFLVGLTMWYCNENVLWRSVLVAAELVVLLGGASVLAVWMWNTMSVTGGLGADETLQGEAKKRSADS